MMSIELHMLLLAVALAFASVLIAVLGATIQVGLPTLAGNREEVPTLTGWAGRAQRAHRNILESLVLFAVLVLIGAVTGRSNQMTVLGAELFVAARLAYLVVYLIGIPWLRTLCWLASVVGLVLLFGALV
jgi:uncharacterized MAPEG superfamily protein